MTPDITTKTISATASAITAATAAAATTVGQTAFVEEAPSPPPPPPPTTTAATATASLSLPLPSSTTHSTATTSAITEPPPAPAAKPSAASSALSSAALVSTPSSIMRRHLLTIEKLRNRVHQILKCVINLHIDILVLESNVNQLLDDVKDFNADLMEVQRLDNLIQTLRDYNGPTICHEWPFPLVCQATIDEADLAQTLNTNDLFTTA